MTFGTAESGATNRTLGSKISIRELHSREEEAIMTFLLHLEPEDVRARFGSLRPSIRYLLPGIDRGRHSVAFAATDTGTTVLGILNLECLTTPTAEIAVITRSDHKRRGIGRLLLGCSLLWAERCGLAHLFGYISVQNTAALALVRAAGFRVIRCDGFTLEVGNTLPVSDL